MKIVDPIFRALLPEPDSLANVNDGEHRPPVVWQDDLVDGDVDDVPSAPTDPNGPNSADPISTTEIWSRILSSGTIYGARIGTGFIEGFFGTTDNSTRCGSRLV